MPSLSIWFTFSEGPSGTESSWPTAVEFTKHFVLALPPFLSHFPHCFTCVSWGYLSNKLPAPMALSQGLLWGPSNWNNLSWASGSFWRSPIPQSHWPQLHLHQIANDQPSWEEQKWHEEGLQTEILILRTLHIRTKTLLADLERFHDIASICYDADQLSFSLLLLRASYLESKIGNGKGWEGKKTLYHQARTQKIKKSY